MAESFTAVPQIIRFQLGGIDVATKLNVPNAGRRVTLYFETNAGKVATSGTDAVAIGTTVAPVVANNYWAIGVDKDADARGKGPAPLYVASPVADTWVVAIVEAL